MRDFLEQSQLTRSCYKNVIKNCFYTSLTLFLDYAHIDVYDYLIKITERKPLKKIASLDPEMFEEFLRELPR
ncbi:MAG: hypothetical protein ACO2OY_00770 [Thermodesulfobacteriaceae bacterium]|jgi:hypothetical protein